MTLEVYGREPETSEQVIGSDLPELGVTQTLVQDKLNWRKSTLRNSLTQCQH